MVARTLTSTIRLLDAVQLFRGDRRLRFRFAVNGTTRFTGGVRDLLSRAQVGQILDWADEEKVPHDLVLSASENIDFVRRQAHTVVLPHGLGFNKMVPDHAGGRRLAGLPPVEVLRAGGATLVLSHPSQAEALRPHHPDIEAVSVVTGDVTFDRLRAGLPCRDRFRDVLHTGDRTLVMVSSTWGTSSLLGRHPTLPAQLLADLPADEYQVCAALHPNIWSRYGPAQIRLWFADELDAGLALLPPESGWDAALVAADQVIADHGSVALLAAGLDRPLLLADTTGNDEMVPGAPTSQIAALAPRLDPARPLRAQVDAARAAHRPGAFTPVTDRVFAHVDDASDRLAGLVYRRLGLAPPEGPVPLLRVGDPPTDAAGPVTSYVVESGRDDDGRLRLVRFPAAVRREPRSPSEHLVSSDGERDVRLRERAAALVCEGGFTDRARAFDRARRALQAHPGLRVAVASLGPGVVGLVRDGPAVEVGPGADPMLAASVIYRCWLGSALTDRELDVEVAGRASRLSIVVTPDPDDRARP